MFLTSEKKLNLGAKFCASKSSNHYHSWPVLGNEQITGAIFEFLIFSFCHIKTIRNLNL